uniref:Coronin-7 n=1 Tax=Panagrolaimus superbus TaxID=310955 RepID=A0A914ZEG0_9BILA
MPLLLVLLERTQKNYIAENGNTEKKTTFTKTEANKIEKPEDKLETATPVIRKIVPKIEEKVVKLREAPPPRTICHSASQVGSRLYESRSPYYNIKAVTAKSKTITDVRDINSRISSDGIFFTASGKYAAVALNKIEGSVAVYDLGVAGRTPDGSVDAIFNKAPIMDLQFDPFVNTKILCALSNGVIKVWDISEAQYCTNKVPDKAQPELGMRNVIIEEDSTHLTLSKLSPIADIKCQVPKVVIVRYNPIVQNLVAVAGSNGTILLINLENGADLMKVNYHKSAIVSLSWSTDGLRLISVDRDCVFVLSDIRKKNDGIIAKKEFKSKSPRAIFVGPIENEFIFVNYLQGSCHKWTLLDLKLNQIKDEDLGLPQGSQSLRPFYDYDSGIVMMSSKSSPNIFMSQVTNEGFIQDILQTTLPSPHQALALLPKNVVDCGAIEIVRVIRLTNNSIEIIPFVVPRREKNLFLRELYPNALVTWEPSMGLNEWQEFKNPSFKYCDLKPDNMTELSFERRPTSSPQQMSGKTTNLVKNINEKNLFKNADKDDSMNSYDLKKIEAVVVKGWSDAIPVDKDQKVPQDEFQGVDDDEWEEIIVKEHS